MYCKESMVITVDKCGKIIVKQGQEMHEREWISTDPTMASSFMSAPENMIVPRRCCYFINLELITAAGYQVMSASVALLQHSSVIK
jgi:hypothetical protein